MPYMDETDQYYWGYSPEPDGTGFDPNKQSPKLSDAYRVLRTHNKKGARLQIAIVGKIYKKKPGQTIQGTTAASVTWSSFESTATSSGLTGKAIKHGGGGFSTEEKIAALLGLKEVPEKITGIYIRILD
jgi:hypothetical protein